MHITMHGTEACPVAFLIQLFEGGFRRHFARAIMKCHPKRTTSVGQVFDIDGKLTPIDDVVKLTETALDRLLKAFRETVFARIPYVCFIPMLGVA